MASDAPTTDEPQAPRPCSACRGTGTVISNLGGSPSEQQCPWCEGRRERLGLEHDAQIAGRVARGEEIPASDDADDDGGDDAA